MVFFSYFICQIAYRADPDETTHDIDDQSLHRWSRYMY